MDTLPIGNISPHESSKEDITVYLHLNSIAYFNYMLFTISIIQLIFFTGFSPAAPVAIAANLYICVKLFLTLRINIIDADFDYSITTKELKKVGYYVIGMVAVMVIDIIISCTVSIDYIRLLFTLRNEYEHKFAYFACFIVLFKLILCSGLWGWIQYVIGYINKHDFMIRKEKIDY